MMIVFFGEDSGKHLPMQKLLRILIIFFLPPLLLLSSGCESLRFPGVFRIDVGQGNLITKEMVDKLRLGMTPRQVHYVMGSPMIADTFHPDRWDYLYNLETGKGIFIENHLVLYFEGERLARIDNAEYKDPEQLRNDLMKQLGIDIKQESTTESGTAAPIEEPRENPATQI
ncbi:MAG TPA: outer membrane protein assembly factor BamE [Dongiaceae bacterium]|nr:outer membrane protein assembly factor BamE [Dongiaceae bacterium]